jgi:hypothetical protein
MAVSKKKVIKSLENLTDELKDLLRDQYPNGYESSITRITNAKREPIFVFPLETEDATFLVKVPVTKNSDGEYDVESKPETEFEAATAANEAESPDFDSSSNDEAEAGFGADDEGSDDYEGSGKRQGEASYDPDFDT